MIMLFCNNVIVFLAGAILVEVTNGASLDIHKDQKEQVMALREFFKTKFTEAIMFEDYWLENWLKSNDFNLEGAKRNIEQHLQVRHNFNLAQILTEDWSQMRTRFPYSFSTTDKSGRPVLYVDFGQWDIASFLTTSEATNHLNRYVALIGKESENHVLQLRGNGQDVTQASVLFNIGGFSSAKHLCKQCAKFYSDFADLSNVFVSAQLERVVFVNVPNHFRTVYSFLNKDFRKLVQLHGQDQHQLEKMLVEYIDRDQIPEGILDEIAVKDNYEGSMMWDKEL